jgi:hypothetical protein
MKLVRTPPIIGAAIRFIISAPVPIDHIIGIVYFSRRSVQLKEV